MPDYFDDYSPSLPAAEPFVTMTNGQARYAPMNDGVTPQFFRDTVQNFAKSETEGRPIYDTQEFVRILIAGDPHNMHVAPVTEEVRRRFAIAYREWQINEAAEAKIEGTPLKQWPLLAPAKIAELRALNIFTVEQLAGLADVNLSRAFDLRALREQAKAWLEQAKDGGAAARYAAENERLREKVSGLESQVANLADQLSALIKKQEEARAESRRK